MEKQPFLIANSDTSSVSEFVSRTAESADEIRLAVAYFSHSELIKRWQERKLRLSFVVALQPPTSPELLRRLLHAGLEIKFYDSRFHSKLYLFYRAGEPFGALVGSANFTNGGLLNNIETNVYVTDPSQLCELSKQFKSMWEGAGSLVPTDVDQYQQFCQATQEQREKINAGYAEFERQKVTPRFRRQRKRVTVAKTVGKVGRDYREFWKRVDEVAGIVGQISRAPYPEIPPYLVIDHFWHWIMKFWNRKDLNRIRSDPEFRRKALPDLFREFIDWDKRGSNYNGTLGEKVKTFSVLGHENISQLTAEQAEEAYSETHLGHRGARRFARENTIGRIRTSLDYLLWDSDDVEQRISALLTEKTLKLKHFKESKVQEFIGWVRPDHPIRNQKADNAVELLGFNFR